MVEGNMRHVKIGEVGLGLSVLHVSLNFKITRRGKVVYDGGRDLHVW